MVFKHLLLSIEIKVQMIPALRKYGTDMNEFILCYWLISISTFFKSLFSLEMFKPNQNVNKK